MNLINAISNLNLRCSKVPIKSSCPGCPCTFSVRFWTATWNPTNYEKPFFSPHFPSFLPLKPTRLELNVQTWWSQSFTILCIEASSLLPRSFSFSGRRRWTSCSLESGGGGGRREWSPLPRRVDNADAHALRGEGGQTSASYPNLCRSGLVKIKTKKN